MATSTTTTGQLLRAKELAERWQMTVGTLANLRADGNGPAYIKFGKAVRYRLEDVEAYEAGRVVEPVR